MTTDKKLARIRYENNQMMVLASYDVTFVSELKNNLKSRRWNPSTKEWSIKINEREKALEVCKRFFNCIEYNQPSEIEEPAFGQPELLQPQSTIKPEWINEGNIDIWVDGSSKRNPGPSGHEENNYCDRLADAEAHRKDLPVDTGYENNKRLF